MPTPETVFEADFGKEPESSWGTVENVHADGVTFSKAMCGIFYFSRQPLIGCQMAVGRGRLLRRAVQEPGSGH
jgi:hypothetical protein